MYDLDNNSFKVLKEIYGHSYCTKDQLTKKFKTDLKDELDLLSLRQLVDNPVTGHDGDNNLIYDYETFFITQPGKAYVDARTKDEWQWNVPMIMSAAALIVSIFALFKP